MITSITFKDPDTIDKPIAESMDYIPNVPALRGKEFRFEPGLNLIIGGNGCGKTSLLSAIRQIYLAEDADGHFEPVSSYSLYSSLTKLAFDRLCESGLYDAVTLKADFSKPLFCHRKPGDIGRSSDSILSSFATVAQYFDSSSRSKGEGTSDALFGLIALMQGKHPGYKDADYLDFAKTRGFIDDLARKSAEEAAGPDPYFSDFLYATKFAAASGYYRANDIGSDSHLTAIMDEPDEGMDVYRLSDLLGLLRAVSQLSRDQFIVAIHNVAIIRALAEIPEVNIIELEPGYLEAVKAFGVSELPARPERREAASEDEEEEGGRDTFRHRAEAYRDALRAEWERKHPKPVTAPAEPAPKVPPCPTSSDYTNVSTDRSAPSFCHGQVYIDEDGTARWTISDPKKFFTSFFAKNEQEIHED